MVTTNQMPVDVQNVLNELRPNKILYFTVLSDIQKHGVIKFLEP